MATGFRRIRSGKVKARLAPLEVALLQRVFTDVLELLGPTEAAAERDPLEVMVGMEETTPPPPDDPALARLLPDGYRDDADASAEFRRFTEASLRETKRAAAQAVLDDLGRMAAGGSLELPPERGELWLAALNDVRLVLGTRLGVTEEIYDDLEARAEDEPGLALYDFLTWMQETLVRALAGW